MFNWKKLGKLATVASLALAPFLTTAGSVQSVYAEEEYDLVISAGGLKDYIDEHIHEFEEESGLKVKVEDTDDMFTPLEHLEMDGAAGIAADVLIAPYDRVGVLAGQELIDEVELLEDAEYDETDKKQVTYDGKIYAAPAVIESIVMYYNKDLLDKAPETFEELEALAEDEKYAFEGEEGKTTAFLAPWTDFYFAYGLISGYGGYVFGNDGTDPTDIGLNSPEAVEGMNYALEWFRRWPLGMQDVSSAADFANQSFMDGKTAAILAGPWMAQSYADAGVNYGVAKIPTLPNGEPYKPFAGGKAWVVSKFSENKENAQVFLDWVSSKEQQMNLYEVHKEIPANQVARKEVADQGEELTTAVIDTYDVGVPMPNISEMGEVWNGAENLMYEAASSETEDAQEAANDTVELIKELIEANH